MSNLEIYRIADAVRRASAKMMQEPTGIIFGREVFMRLNRQTPSETFMLYFTPVPSASERYPRFMGLETTVDDKSPERVAVMFEVFNR